MREILETAHKALHCYHSGISMWALRFALLLVASAPVALLAVREKWVQWAALGLTLVPAALEGLGTVLSLRMVAEAARQVPPAQRQYAIESGREWAFAMLQFGALLTLVLLVWVGLWWLVRARIRRPAGQAD